MKRRINILLLEDNKYDYELIRRELIRSYLDFQLKQVDNEKDYLAELTGNKYDIILADYNLPGYNGYEAMKAAKLNCENVPFIIISGYIGEERAIEILREGAWDYVFKDKLLKLKVSIISCLRRADEVTKRVKAEEALSNSMQEFKALVNNSPDIIERFNRDLTRVYINPAITHLFGKSVEYYTGKKLTFKSNVIDDITTGAAEHIQKVFLEGTEKQTELMLETIKGKKYFHIRIVPEFDKEHNVNYVLVVSRDVTDYKFTAEKLLDTVKEKDLLLYELNHRIKNNLQVITSLIKREEDEALTDDTRSILRDTRNKIYSISKVYEMLYKSSDLNNLNVKDYINNLVSELYEAFNISKLKIQFVNNAGDSNLNLKTSLPFSLMINEIITNSFKYAFPMDKSGVIGINLKKKDKKIDLEIYDNGVGFPPEMDVMNIEKIDTLGIKLITLFNQQLNGKMEVINKEGVKYRFSFEELN